MSEKRLQLCRDGRLVIVWCQNGDSLETQASREAGSNSER